MCRNYKNPKTKKNERQIIQTWKRICRHYKNQKIIKKPMLKAKMYVHGKVYVVILKIEKKKKALKGKMYAYTHGKRYVKNYKYRKNIKKII